MGNGKWNGSIQLNSMDILIVDDEKSIRLTTSLALESEGHYVETAEEGNLALKRIKEENFDLVFLDLRLGDEDGLEILQKIVAMKPQQLVTIFTAHASISTAVKATQLGAFDYLEKPFTPDQLRTILIKAQKALRTQGEVTQLKEVVQELKSEVRHTSPPLRFTSEDAKTRDEFDILFRAAATNASILILGESGTGKSVIAREIHDRSHLRDKPFVTVSCPSLSKELLESVLFGHMKGSFTGAIKDTWGKVHAAEGGTLFLDEIGELPMEIQPKLLRLLQEREYERLGENKVRESNVRVIAATNRDLQASIRSGEFREDLYYRLNVISVTVPALRDRPADLARFAKDYLEFFVAQLGRRIDGFSEKGRTALMRHPWPGNLRELRNAIERAAILSKGTSVDADDLPNPATILAASNGHDSGEPGIGGEHSLEEVEQAHLTKVLGWAPSLHDAAAVLGIDKATLYRKRKRYGIT
jgi:two-component system, NtrC family, response regulator AlgB